MTVRQLSVPDDKYLRGELDWASKNGVADKLRGWLIYALMWGPETERRLFRSHDLGEHGFVVHVDMPAGRPFVMGLHYREDEQNWSAIS